jgi:predicted nuclease of predicted toxin-antitoxin system
MIRLLLDQGLPRSAARILREREIDAVHVGEISMSTAADSAILARAHSERRTVVTLDADFHALLALSDAHSPSVIRLRIEGLQGIGAADLIQQVLELTASEVQAGAVVAVTTAGVRVKRLPIRGWDSGR